MGRDPDEVAGTTREPPEHDSGHACRTYLGGLVLVETLWLCRHQAECAPSQMVPRTDRTVIVRGNIGAAAREGRSIDSSPRRARSKTTTVGGRMRASRLRGNRRRAGGAGWFLSVCRDSAHLCSHHAVSPIRTPGDGRLPSQSDTGGPVTHLGFQHRVGLCRDARRQASTAPEVVVDSPDPRFSALYPPLVIPRHKGWLGPASRAISRWRSVPTPLTATLRQRYPTGPTRSLR